MATADLSDLAQADLLAAAKDTGAYVVIIGAQAVRHYGYRRFTEDVDAACDRMHFRDLVAAVEARGYLREALLWFSWRHPDGRRIDLLPEGASVIPRTPPFFPHPRHLAEPGGYVILPVLIQMKLFSGRGKDAQDVMELLKAGIEIDAADISGAVRDKFLELRERAKTESER